MDTKCRRIISKYLEFLINRIDLIHIRSLVEDRKIFTENMLEDIYNSNNSSALFFHLLCTRGPYAFSKFIHILIEAGYIHEANRLQNEFAIDHDLITYKMTSKPIGLCLIIINKEFDAPVIPRIGSEIDATALESLFKTLGYEVSIECDLTVHQMKSCLQNFARNPRFKDVDSSVVFIATHGSQLNNCDVLYGIHNVPLTTTTIYAMFNNINCELLARKPKMFFFQSCRGHKEDLGYYKNIKMSHDAFNFGDAMMDNSEEYVDCHPTMTDMFIVHSTLPNYVSIRDHSEGSWFCQDVVDVFSMDYIRHDLETMLESVCRRMETRISEDLTKQTIHVELYGVIGKVWFNRKIL